MSFRWVVIVVLLILGIDGLLTRLLESLWVSLRDRNSPAYLPLEWWMSLPFTLFVFAVLSALLTSFSGLRNWFRTFLLLWGLKVVFAAVTAFSFSYRPYPDLLEAASQATLLSLPCVLVHILLSGILVMLLRDLFAAQPMEEAPAYPGMARRQRKESALPTVAGPDKPQEVTVAQKAAVLARPAREAEPFAPVVEKEEAPEEVPAPIGEGGFVVLPVKELLPSFPTSELALSPSEIEDLLPSVQIPLKVILPQLPEGKIEVKAEEVISGMPVDAFASSAEEVARKFPGGKIELPLREVVSQLPPGVLDLPPQELQPEVDAEFPDPFHEISAPPFEEVAEKPAPVVEEYLEEAAPLPEEVPEPVRELSEADLVVSEQERVLFERSRDVVELSVESIIPQFPDGALTSGSAAQSPHLPDTVLVPLRFVLPQLAQGEAKLHVKYILAQFPEGCLSISELDLLRSLPNGEIELPLREIVPQLPPDVLAPPEQIQQPDLEDMPEPFLEAAPPQPLEEEVAPPAEEVAPPVVVAPPPREERPAAPSYADMLQEENPLALSVDTVVALLPEGSFRLSAEELKLQLRRTAVDIPRSMVMAQLKEGRVLVPVEILTLQFPPDHLDMSIEQIKARFAEGLVQLPLREIVEQVLTEVAQPPEGQRLQPECEEISAPFGDILLETSFEAEALPHSLEVEEEPIPSGVPGTEAAVALGVKAAPAKRVEPSPAAAETAQKEVAPAETVRTILRTILQKCKGLGVSEHVSFVAGDYSAIVLAPSSLNRQAAACGMIEIMTQLRQFSRDFHIGPPHKLVVYSTRGALVGGHLVRGQADRLIILGSLNRSGAGLMSLLLDRFETELRELSSLSASDLELTAVQRALNPRVERIPLRPDGLPEETCQQILAVLRDLDIEHCFSAKTASDQKLVAAWGQGSFGDVMRDNGIFNTESLSRHCSEAGLGEFESLLLVTDHARVTWNRSPADPSAYLLCFFAENYGEGLVRAKAGKAANLL